MIREITFEVPVRPVSQGSMNRGANGRMYHSNRELPGYRNKITAEAIKAARKAGWKLPIDGAVATEETYYLPKPKTTRFKDYPAGKPDLDKLERAVGDALSPREERFRVLSDDARICRRTSVKDYPAEGGCPCVVVTITLLEGAGNE